MQEVKATGKMLAIGCAQRALSAGGAGRLVSECKANVAAAAGLGEVSGDRDRAVRTEGDVFWCERLQESRGDCNQRGARERWDWF